jgi:hypothetical protein
MTGLSESFSGWWLHAAIGGGFLLFLAWGLTLVCRQPAWSQRLGEWGLLASLLVAGLSFVPAWLAIPILPPENAASNRPSPASSPERNSQTEAAIEKAQKRPPDVASVLPPGTAEPLLYEDDEANLELWIQTPSGSLSLWALQEHNQAREEAYAGGREQVRASKPNRASSRGDSPPAPAAASVDWKSAIPGFILNSLTAAYLLLGLTFFCRWLFGHLVLWRMLRRACPAPEFMNSLFHEITGGRTKAPRLLVSERLKVPISCGLLRPTIVVPAPLCDPDAKQELSWALRHELTHLERRDSWACFLFGLSQAIYFYLPWFWWLRRQVRLCQEYVADAAAVEQTPEVTDYAQFLLGLTQNMTVPVAAMGVSGNSSDLFRRMTMLLQNPLRVQTRCPRWLSPAAAFGLLGLAVLLSGVSLRAEPKSTSSSDPFVTVGQQEPKQPPPPPKQEEEPKKDKRKGPRSVPRDEDSEGFPPFDGRPFGPGGPRFPFGRPARLGIAPSRPSPALVDQLDLPEGQGLVIEDVRPDTPAAKAGLKVHDIILEFNGKPVPNDPRRLIQMIDEVKADTPVDAVVIRKGKKETIKGISMPEVRRPGPSFRRQPGEFQPPGPGPRGGRGTFSTSARHNMRTTLTRDDDHFTARHQEGPLFITVTGTVADGKANINLIEIQDGPKTDSYRSVDKVPEQYREQVKNLLDMSERGTSKTEIRPPEKKPGEKSKRGDEEKD